MLNSLPQPSGPPAPPEPVPFPEQEGPRALPANGEEQNGGASAGQGFVPVFARTVDGKPMTEQQARNLFDFLNSRTASGEQQQSAEYVGEEVDGSFDYVPSANETNELRSHVRLESDEIKSRLRLLSQAAEAGMFGIAESIIVVLIEFQQCHFERHQRIISLTEAWAMLVGVVNLALPDEK